MLVMFFLIAFSGSLGSSMPIQADAIDRAVGAEISSCLPSGQTQKFRTRFDIIWSCVSTLFICTWVAVHPNVPPRGESSFWSLLRRIRLMIWMLVVPELVLVWAYRQWAAAKYIAEVFKDEGWTPAHGHFLTMGGFSLDRAGVETVLDYESFFELLKIQTRASRSRHEPIFSESFEIAFPTITCAEIQDKARGDFLSKAIVILQSTWFIVQCIARGTQGLALTEFELVTLALASLNGVMYFFWWDKPLGVQEPIKVYVKGSRPTEKVVDGTGRFQRFQESPQPTFSQKCASSLQEMRSSISRAFSAAYSSMKNFHDDQRKMWGCPGCMWWCFCLPLLLFVFYPLAALFFLGKGFFFLCKDLYNIATTTEIKPNATHVPTFYAPRTFLGVGSSVLFLLVLPLVAATFGALHCIAWNFQFPTPIEQSLWRIGSLAITVIPLVPPGAMVVSLLIAMILMPLYYALCITLCPGLWGPILGLLSRIWGVIGTGVELVMGVIASIVALAAGTGYMVARLVLLTQAIILLRAQPESAYYAISWSRYLPHL